MLAALVMSCAVCADTVERRGAEGTLRGEIVLVDTAGVTIRTESGATHHVPWDRVRNVDTPRRDPELDRRLAMGADLWRARTRLERNDPALAEPLFERLFAEFRGQTHETALVAAEGLLRCRLARGEQAAALIPALETIRLRRAKITTDSYSGLRPAIDEDLDLCPYLPPAWIRNRALVNLRHDLSAYVDSIESRSDEVLTAIARLYARSVAVSLEPTAGTDDGTADGSGPSRPDLPDHAGVDLMAAAVGSAATTGSERERARRRLRDAARAGPMWVDAWARYFQGTSLLGESGVGRQQQGLVSLAHVPARFGPAHWFLSGLALGRMMPTLTAHRDFTGADAIRAVLERSYSGHPVLKENP